MVFGFLCVRIRLPMVRYRVAGGVCYVCIDVGMRFLYGTELPVT